MSTRLDRAYRAQIRTLRQRLETFVGRQFAAAGWADEDMMRFVVDVAPVALASRRHVSMLTDAYLARKVSALGYAAKPIGPIDTDALRGVDAALVYQRPFITARTKFSEGKDVPSALSAGVARASDLVRTDLQLAKTHTARNTLTRAGVERYVRVLSGDSCALCYVAATQTYSTEDLMPIHPGCNCDVDVAPSDFDGSEQLAATHEAIEERFGSSAADARAIDYRKAILVQEHGEMGPTLAVKSHTFTETPSAAATASGTRRLGFDTLTREQVDNQIRVLEGLPDTKYKRDTLAKYRERQSQL